MKKYAVFSIVLLLLCAAVFFITDSSRAQDTTTTTSAYNPALIKILWDAPTTNEDGTPLTDLSHYDIAVSRSPENPDASTEHVEFARVDCDQSTCDMVLWEKFQGIMDDAATIYVQVRAIDEALNASDWSEQLAIKLDTLPPGIPLNLRIEIQVTASVTVTTP